jgi:hypothetical protein
MCYLYNNSINFYNNAFRHILHINTLVYYKYTLFICYSILIEFQFVILL